MFAVICRHSCIILANIYNIKKADATPVIKQPEITLLQDRNHSPVSNKTLLPNSLHQLCQLILKLHSPHRISLGESLSSLLPCLASVYINSRLIQDFLVYTYRGTVKSAVTFSWYILTRVLSLNWDFTSSQELEPHMLSYICTLL